MKEAASVDATDARAKWLAELLELNNGGAGSSTGGSIDGGDSNSGSTWHINEGNDDNEGEEGDDENDEAEEASSSSPPSSLPSSSPSPSSNAGADDVAHMHYGFDYNAKCFCPELLDQFQPLALFSNDVLPAAPSASSGYSGRSGW